MSTITIKLGYYFQTRKLNTSLDDKLNYLLREKTRIKRETKGKAKASLNGSILSQTL